MKIEKMVMKGLALLVILPIVGSLLGCFRDRVVTDPEYEARDVRRPGVAHHVPLSSATEVSRSTTITIWFDELMDEPSMQSNFLVWPSVQVDSIKVLAIDPNNGETLYAAKPGTGIFKSEDGAESWQWITPVSMRMMLTDLVISRENSNLLYAATADSGVFKSLDGGMLWQPVRSGLPELQILAVAVDPKDENVIYAVTNSSGIYKSTDGGLNWLAKNNGVRPARGPRDIAINPLNSNTLYAATRGDFILKSVDGGESWIRLRTGLFTFNFNKIAIHPRDTSLVFAVADKGGVYRSSNGGTNWDLVVAGLSNLNILSIALAPQDTNRILVSTTTGIFKSLDRGEHWTRAGEIPTGSVAAMLVSDPTTPGRVFAATSSGIYLSEDSGNSWIEKNNLPPENLYVTGTYSFENWQDSTMIIAPLNATTMDTTIIYPYVYERALAAWIANGKKGKPPVEVNPPASKMIFTPDNRLPPRTKIQVKIRGSFESDRETLRDSYGAEDINGNSLEVDYNFSFITGKN